MLEPYLAPRWASMHLRLLGQKLDGPTEYMGHFVAKYAAILQAVLDDRSCSSSVLGTFADSYAKSELILEKAITSRTGSNRPNRQGHHCPCLEDPSKTHRWAPEECQDIEDRWDLEEWKETRDILERKWNRESSGRLRIDTTCLPPASSVTTIRTSARRNALPYVVTALWSRVCIIVCHGLKTT